MEILPVTRKERFRSAAITESIGSTQEKTETNTSLEYGAGQNRDEVTN